MYADWEEKEERFHLAQQRERTKRRLVKFRCKPIDAVAKNILLVQQIEEGLTVGIDGKTGTVLDGTRVIFSASEPFHVLDKLSLNELKELKIDIEEYLAMSDQKYALFWGAMLGLCEEAINWESMPQSVRRSRTFYEGEIFDTFAGKSSDELRKMAVDIDLRLRDESRTTEREYWEHASRSLRIQLARIDVSETHKRLLSVWESTNLNRPCPLLETAFQAIHLSPQDQRMLQA